MSTSSSLAAPVLIRMFEPLLSPHGLSRPRVDEPRWVRARPPLRDVFEVEPQRGGRFCPRWGISLDFVPHEHGSELRYHGTDRSARMDIVYSPLDLDAEIASSTYVKLLEAEGDDAARLAVDAALEWFERFDESSLLPPVEALRAAYERSPRFRFRNFVAHRISYPFVLAHAGEMERARAALAEIEQTMRETTFERLRAEMEALAAARLAE